MSTSASDIARPTAVSVAVTDNAITLGLGDGRSLSVPVEWYPRLQAATSSERSNWRLLGHGRGIHWPDIDEDISVEDLLAGRPSAESPASLARWLETRHR